jgi:hypothetical protein
VRVFENRALRRIFGPRRHEVPGGWRELLDEELRNCSERLASKGIASLMPVSCLRAFYEQ